MKLRNLFYLLLALPLAFAACSDDTTDPAPKPDEPTVKDPVLTLTSAASVEVAAEGETIEITYTLENKKEGVELEATCEAEWVEVVAGDKVSVTVAANEGEARETKVVVKYDTQSFEVALKQVAKGEEPVKPAEPKLTLTSESNVDVTAAGGEFEITYTLENKKDGVELTATCEAQWVDVTVGEKVKVVVEANEGDAREAKVVVAYETQKFEVTYKQAKKEDVPVVPSEPVAFVPKKVTASHTNMSAGNFVLNLYIDDAQRFEFDMYDKVSANDSYLTPGKYTSVDGSIDLKYSQLYVSKDDKTAMAAAELELGLNQEEWTFTLKGSYELVNGAKYTIDWTGSIEGFVDPTAPVVKTYNIVSFEASARSATVWDINMTEKDPMKGDMYTRITIQLPEDNTKYITDGTYSVENGGILVNSSTENGYSTWRHNVTAEAADIQICEVKVANDLEAETSVIEGSIQIGLDVYVFKYEGMVSGFMYKELGDEGITQWDKFILRNQYENCKILYGYTGGKLDAPFVEFNIFKEGGKKSDPVAAGTYVVAPFGATGDYCLNEVGGINGNKFMSGQVVVEILPDGQYKISFDVVVEPAPGNAWKGTYIGELPYEPYQEE